MQALVVPGRLESLEKIGKFIMQAASQAGLEKARIYKLRLAVDEIATNIINYGYAQAGLEGLISVEAELDEHALTVTLEDSSGYFDPTLRPPPPPEYFTQPLEQRDIGGWGVYLALQSVDQFQYHRLRNHNQNVFVMYLATHGNLLLIDSSNQAAELTSEHLTRLGYTVTRVEDGKKGRDLIAGGKFEMALIDLPLVDQPAQDFIKSLKADNALRGVPVIILIVPDLLEEAEKCITAGAEDYIVLPISPVMLKARLSVNLERQRVRLSEYALREKANFDRDMQIGQQIQLSFFPESLAQVPGWETAAHFDPAHEVAGDFYDSFPLEKEYIGLVMGDVSDRGINAALFMALFRSLLRAFSQQTDHIDQFDPKKPANRQSANPKDENAFTDFTKTVLKTALERTNAYILTNHKSSNMYASIFFGILEPASGKLAYINAGHEAPLIIKQGDIKVRLEPNAVVLGIELDNNFEVSQAQIDPGEALLIYTDGVLEVKNPSGEMFGRERFLDLLKENASTPASLLSRIEKNLHSFMAEANQVDDIALLAIQRIS